MILLRDIRYLVSRDWTFSTDHIRISTFHTHGMVAIRYMTVALILAREIKQENKLFFHIAHNSIFCISLAIVLTLLEHLQMS